MTMPCERTRSLGLGWEYMMERRESDNLTVEQRYELDEILWHYPSAVEIKEWAIDCAGDGHFKWLLQPEEDKPCVSKTKVTSFLIRGLTEPHERAQAVRMAGLFVRALRSTDNLRKEQKRQIEYVLRHFPAELDIQHYVRKYESAIRKKTVTKIWLSKRPGEDSVHDQKPLSIWPIANPKHSICVSILMK